MRPLFTALLATIATSCCLSGCNKNSSSTPRDGGMDATQDAKSEAGALSCEFNGRTYQIGEEHCSNDNCNTCWCDKHIDPPGSICTTVGCLPNRDAGFAICGREQWHLPDASAATTLALYGDGSFRWLALGCDGFAQDQGVWLEAAGSITLSPAPGREGFSWPGTTTTYSTFDLTRSGDSLSADIGETQVWQRGGLCPVCNATDAGTRDAGAQTNEACMNPWANCSENTFECKAREW